VKTLHLLRHAKSAWDEPGRTDRERGLNARGRRDAPRMGEALAAELAPMAVHVSPARRAQLTLKGVCAGWPELGALEHTTEEALYTFAGGVLAEWIARRPEPGDSLFIIGHNPALTDLVNTLAGSCVLDNLPTAGYARLLLDIRRWRDVHPGCGRLDELLRPRDLPAA